MLAGACMATQDMIALVSDNVTTTETADVTSSSAIDGCVDRIYLVPMDATNALTVTISLTATDQYTSETRTLLSSVIHTNITSLSISPRVANVTTANAATTYDFSKFRLHNDKVNLNVSSASATNRTVKAYIYFDR